MYPLPSPYGIETFLSDSCEYGIIRKQNEKLTVFSNEADKWEAYEDRMIDHFCKSSSKWRLVIESIESAPAPFTGAQLEVRPIGNGETAWTVANELENVLVDYLSDTLCDRRHQLCGGKAQKGNGSEIWRERFL